MSMRQVKQWMLSLAAGVAVSGMVAHAHHSISTVYDGSRKVTVEGVVVQFHLVNPHPFVMVEVKDASGKAQQWRLEMDNRSELAEIGVTTETLKPGDWVVVAGSPARAQSNSLYVLRLDRPADGFRYEQVGNSPRIRVPSR
jgi:hypothetical protein